MAVGQPRNPKYQQKHAMLFGFSGLTGEERGTVSATWERLCGGSVRTVDRHLPTVTPLYLFFSGRRPIPSFPSNKGLMPSRLVPVTEILLIKAFSLILVMGAFVR